MALRAMNRSSLENPLIRARRYAQVREYQAYADDPEFLLAQAADLNEQARASRREVARLNHELAAVRRELAVTAARRDRLDDLYRKQTARAERFKHAHAQLLQNPAVRLIHFGGKAGQVLRRVASSTVQRRRGQRRPNERDAAKKSEESPHPVHVNPLAAGPVLPELPPLGAHPGYQPVSDRILLVRGPSENQSVARGLTSELRDETVSDTARRLEWQGADVVVHRAQPVPESLESGWQVVADEIGRALMKHRPSTVHLAETDPTVRAAAEVAARRFNVPVVMDPAVDPTAPVGLETRRYFPQRRDRDLVRVVRTHLKLEPDDVVVLLPAPEGPARTVPTARRVLTQAGDDAEVKVVFYLDDQAQATVINEELAVAGLRNHALALPRTTEEGSEQWRFDRLLTLADFLLWEAPADATAAERIPESVQVRAEAMDVLTLTLELLGELKRWVNDPPARADAARQRRRRAVERFGLAERAEQLWAQHRALAAGPSATKQPTVGELHIGLIADEFTTAALESEIGVTALKPENWTAVLAEEPIDALIVESAWAGNGGAWTRGIGHYSDVESQPLRDLVAACREKSIPTIFWNKEDPVHTDRFIENARLFDVVGTTDADCLPTYLEHVGPGTQVISVPFFAQPRLHHPLAVDAQYQQPSKQNDGGEAPAELVAYAGTFYGDRYLERSAELEMLLGAAGQDLAIYDRQLTVPNSPYTFPENLAAAVKAGLTYQETLMAYRDHPIHLNVNSVTISPTMFSRRVAEIAACGTPVISGRGEAIANLFGDLVPQPSCGQDARELIDYWRDHPAERRRDGWRLAQHVYRSHLASHRLVTMLRTAGLAVDGPALPAYQLELAHLTEDVARSVLAQTHRPQRVVWRGDSSSGAVVAAVGLLTQAGVDVSPDPDPTLASAVLRCSGDATGELLREPTRAEDLARLWWIGQIVESPHAPVAAALVADEDAVADCQRSDRSDAMRCRPATQTLSKKAPEVWFGTRPAEGDQIVHAPRQLLCREEVPSAPQRDEPPTLLVAGHDLKFAAGIVGDLQAAGWQVLTDEWDDHDEHDADQSERLLRQADVVWCEWALGNAAWYVPHVEPHQRLVVRFHSQELFTPYLRDVDLSRVDRWIFVGEHIREAACVRYGLDRASTTVIPNAVDPALFDLPKDPEARFRLGLVGMVPSQKHLDRALDLLATVRTHDDRFRLVVKGKLPEEYPWIMRQEDQRQYFERQFERCNADPVLAGAVDFEGFGMDMTDFYGRIGVALSTSDFESFHLTLADGAASGAVPMSLAWPGVEDIYPREWVYDDVAAMAADLLSCADHPEVFAERGAAAREAARQFSRSAVVHSLIHELASK